MYREIELDIAPGSRVKHDYILTPREKKHAFHSAKQNNLQRLNDRRQSPKMFSHVGNCKITRIPPFKNQVFPCKIMLESGRGWAIFIQPANATKDQYFKGSYFSFMGYSEECGFGIGCPFSLEVQDLSKVLQKAPPLTRTPTDFKIRKWDRSELKLTFDMEIYESIFTFKANALK